LLDSEPHFLLLPLTLFLTWGLSCKTFYGRNHRHLSNIDCLMARTTFLVCFISTVNCRSKQKRKRKGKCLGRCGTSSGQSIFFGYLWSYLMEQRTLRNVNNYLNTNIYSYLETSGGLSSNLYLKVVHFFNVSVIRHLWQLKTIVFLHWCLMRAFLFRTVSRKLVFLSLSVTQFPA
jgi:hypothetical protein